MVLALLLFTLNFTPAMAEPVQLLGADLSDWMEESFAGHTRYAMSTLEGAPVLVANSDAAASTLFREKKIDLDVTPVLRWRWRVDNVFPGLDETTRAHDDHPARLYVIAKHKFLPWRARALCYVWTSGRPAGSAWPNPYSPEVMMVALRSSDAERGAFAEERRDVRADFKRFFNVEQRWLSGIAVMTDTDNTGQKATSYYADIRFHARER